MLPVAAATRSDDMEGVEEESGAVDAEAWQLSKVTTPRRSEQVAEATIAAAAPQTSGGNDAEAAKFVYIVGADSWQRGKTHVAKGFDTIAKWLLMYVNDHRPKDQQMSKDDLMQNVRLLAPVTAKQLNSFDCGPHVVLNLRKTVDAVCGDSALLSRLYAARPGSSLLGLFDIKGDANTPTKITEYRKDLVAEIIADCVDEKSERIPGTQIACFQRHQYTNQHASTVNMLGMNFPVNLNTMSRIWPHQKEHWTKLKGLNSEKATTEALERFYDEMNWFDDEAMNVALFKIFSQREDNDALCFNHEFMKKLEQHDYELPLEAYILGAKRFFKGLPILDKKVLAMPRNAGGIHWQAFCIVNPGALKQFILLDESDEVMKAKEAEAKRAMEEARQKAIVAAATLEPVCRETRHQKRKREERGSSSQTVIEISDDEFG